MSKHPHRNISAAVLTTHDLVRATVKPLWAVIVSLVTLSTTSTIEPAQAFSITYNFTVQVTSDAYETQGIFNGTTEQGHLTYDDENLIGIGSEYVSGSQGNLTIQFNFLDQIYTEQADLNYGNNAYLYDYPAAFFADGTLLGLDFLVVPSQLQPPQNAPGFRIFTNQFYIGAIDNSDSGTFAGTVAYGIATPESPDPDDGTEPEPSHLDHDPVPVPEPSEPNGGTGSVPEPEPSESGGNTAAVPEPSEVSGAIVAFSFLGLLVMRKVKGQKN